jgi:hypothetical protein
MKIKFKGRKTMKFPQNKAFFLTMALGVLALVGLWFIEKNIATSHAIEPNIVERIQFNRILASETQETILAELKNQEKQIWLTLEKILEITQEECNRLKSQDWKKAYAKTEKALIKQYEHIQELSEENYKIACEVLTECGIDPTTIIITSWDHPSAAAATDGALFINEEIFIPLSDKVKRFALAHEISHMINKDYSTRFVIKKMARMKKIDSDELSHTLALLSQFTEGRADIIAVLRNQEYAQGQVEFMTAQLEKLGNVEYKEYPTNGLRLELGKKVLALHQANKTALA